MIEISVLEKLPDMVVEEYVTKKERVWKTMVTIEFNENSISAELQYQMIESYLTRTKIIMAVSYTHLPWDKRYLLL